MTYDLYFHPKALKEWSKLDKSIKAQFKKKLAERLENPYVPKDKLSGFDNIYKIKLRSSGFRLVYRVNEEKIEVIVLVVQKRENDLVYKILQDRAKN